MTSGAVILSNYVDGAFVTTPEHFTNTCPLDGHTVNLVAAADRAMVDAAVAAARAAMSGSWGQLAPAERADLLRAVADGIERRFDDFVSAEVADTGKPVADARSLDIPRGAANFRVFADLALAAASECHPMTTADGRGALNYTVRKPLGVVGVIAPWNLPLLLLTWKVAPAMAAGNAVIAKPSEETPSSATLLAEVMHEAGVPAGAFNLLHGFGPDATGEWLSAHPDVDAITFTGETATGTAIMKRAADTVKALSFELGGKNPAIVFADADLEAAVAGTARSTFTNCGQVCLCTERVYVERPIFNEFVARLTHAAEALSYVDAAAGDGDLGPLISTAHRDKVLAYFDTARGDGATLHTGGAVPEFGDARDGGAFVAPTIWTGLPEHSRCVREEIFGPVCHVAPFDGEDEAIAMANDTRYGLAAALWTRDLSRAHRVAPRITAGLVWVNTWYLRDLRTPFGGTRLSGIGREGGMHSLNFYSEPSNICIKL
ncbi:MAG: 2-hydroxymuconic semialdehyde dehydrogenase [Gammaproteobacteria bacterium]|nr:2-hydroxymuconic semialdehyde dehydrogenase [Gammaproteobacteria bacterium]NNM00740.1 2-hydroxymuconic semialdehyde dehydrogenase [Gammaproteobacteria bacterium]